RGRPKGRTRVARLALFAVMNNLALLLRSPILVLLTAGLGIHYLVSNLLSLALLTVLRYSVADVWIWARDPLGRDAQDTHAYDIHGLVSVRSEVALPELEGFRVTPNGARPMIDVRLGAVSPSTVEVEFSSNGHGPERRIRYREALGNLGFGVEITVGGRIEVVAYPALLSRRERAGLLVQSRIHSRSGRRLAMIIARLHLPAATINLLVQALVPPPKYFVERLVPGVARAGGARLERMVVIQRDGEGVYVLDGQEALDTLMANSADAYGFPPYDAIEGFLNNNGRDLRLDERAI